MQFSLTRAEDTVGQWQEKRPRRLMGRFVMLLPPVAVLGAGVWCSKAEPTGWPSLRPASWDIVSSRHLARTSSFQVSRLRHAYSCSVLVWVLRCSPGAKGKSQFRSKQQWGTSVREHAQERRLLEHLHVGSNQQ